MSYGQMAPMFLPTGVRRFYEGDLWSSYYFAQGAATANTTNDLYSTPRGQQGQGWPTPLSIAETNMREGGRIANGLAFTVRQLACELKYTNNWGLTRVDILNFQKNAVPVWSFLQSEVEVAPVALIGQGGGIFGATADTGAVEGGAGGSRTILNMGAGQTWIYHELPVLLPAGVSFNLVLKFGSGGIAIDGGLGTSNLMFRAHLLGVATSAIAPG